MTWEAVFQGLLYFLFFLLGRQAERDKLQGRRDDSQEEEQET